MPFDPYRTVVAALDRLTTQVGRVADAVSTPVVEDADTPQTTDDDALTRGAEQQRTDRRMNLRILLNQLNQGPVPLTPAQVQALTALVADEIVDCNTERKAADRRAAELARIRRALDPDDETYVRETVDEQFAMARRIERLEAAARKALYICGDQGSDVQDVLRAVLDAAPPTAFVDRAAGGN